MKTKLVVSMMVCLFSRVNTYSQTQLWGTAEWGGVNNSGAIFRADANGTNFQVAYSFVNATGEKPLGNVVLANNGKLYGVTELGGFGDSCVIYSYEPSTNTYTNIYDLYQFTQFGWQAQSSMIKAANGMLYGLCAGGGAHGQGVIFKIDPATDTYSDIHDFNYPDGGGPRGSLIQLSNGKLYGMTHLGGMYGGGVIFSFDPANNAYTKLYDFTLPSGEHPYYGCLLQAANSKLYGTTAYGGSTGDGVIFSFDLSSNVYADLHNFNWADGSFPSGSLIQATNGVLYGMTNLGGNQGKGTIFSYDIPAGSYTVLHEFQGIDGANPPRGLTQGSNGNLFGTTTNGGAHGKGVAFSYDILTGNYNVLVDFDNLTTGSNPNCDLVITPVLTPTGIEGTETPTLQNVYPNPATNYLTVTGSSKDDILHFTDACGREMLSLKISSYAKKEVDISHFPGVFFIQNQHGETRKIIRE